MRTIKVLLPIILGILILSGLIVGFAQASEESSVLKSPK